MMPPNPSSLPDRELLQTLIDAIPSAVFYKNTQQQYIGFNKAFEAYTGISRHKARGKTVFDIFDKERAQIIHKREKDFLESSEDLIVFESEQFDAALNEMRYFVIRKAKFYNPDGSLGGLVAIMFDVTDRAQLTKDLQQTNQELVKKDQQIASSIAYASRVQKNIFLEQDIIHEHFCEAFILFTPKDVISGDFYFFAQKNHLLLVAAVDCTGHGIPAALMTVLGNNLLEHIVHEQNIFQPNEILQILDIRLKKALRRRDINEEIQDGMELAFCAIDTDSRKLIFSGAKRPLYYVRENELHQIQGSRFSIGGKEPKKEKNFQQETLDIRDEDIFYIFTDGFPDQLNGAGGSRLTSKRFREILSKISHLPLQEQKKRLLSEFEKWRNSYPQVDDILIIGIKPF